MAGYTGEAVSERHTPLRPLVKDPLALKKSLYVVLVARETDGSLSKVPVPIHFVYLFVAAAVIGMVTVAGLAGSYSRMLLKTEKFNQLRQEREQLRKDYARLESREKEKEVQAASLGALASEVSALYGFTATKLAVPAQHLFHGRKAAKSSGTVVASNAIAPGSADGTLTTPNYYKSLDTFYALRNSAMSGDASRAIASSFAPSPLDAFGSLAPGGGLASGPNVPTLWPVVGPISSPFGQREDPILGAGEGEFHKGLDISAPRGTPIHVTAPGVVEMAGIGNGYGTEVVVNHGNGIRTIYGHMSGLHCSVGQQVVRGEVIGYVGNSGRTTGMHVHYEVRIRDVAVNPHKYLQNTANESAPLFAAR